MIAKSRSIFFVLCIALVSLLLAACAPATLVSPNQQTATALQGTFSSQFFLSTQQALLLTAQARNIQPPFLIVTPISQFATAQPPVSTLIALTAQPCNLVLVTQDLPEMTRIVRDSFAQIEALNGVQVNVSATGENCFDSDGSLRYFAARTTHVHLAANVQSLSSLEPIAHIVQAAYDTLNVPLAGKIPAYWGEFHLTLTAGTAVGSLHTTFTEIAVARAQGFNGGAFIDALGGVIQQ
jgi:hypothetical protein